MRIDTLYLSLLAVFCMLAGVVSLWWLFGILGLFLWYEW